MRAGSEHETYLWYSDRGSGKNGDREGDLRGRKSRFQDWVTTPDWEEFCLKGSSLSIMGRTGLGFRRGIEEGV
jgi:hypothetical protein